MRRLFILFLLAICFTNCNAQSKLGDVAAVYIHTTDLDSSVAVYEKLGFPKIASNTFPSPWAQVSDGSVLIMLRKDPNPYIGLTYYSNNVDEIAGQLEKAGVVFAQKPKEGDQIRRYYFKSPDGFTIGLSGNPGGFTKPSGRTMMDMKPTDYQASDKYPNALCGAFGEFCHPVTDLTASIEFWKKIGFTLRYQESAPYPHAILSDGLMIIGLHQTNHFSFPAVTYFGMNAAARIEQLKGKGLKNFSEQAGPGNQSLTTWEGQHFFLFSIGM
jgi:predicted lactoylglutathione lyase